MTLDNKQDSCLHSISTTECSPLENFDFHIFIHAFAEWSFQLPRLFGRVMRLVLFVDGFIVHAVC